MQYAMGIDYIHSKTMKTRKIWDAEARYIILQFKRNFSTLYNMIMHECVSGEGRKLFKILILTKDNRQSTLLLCLHSE